MKAEVLKGGVNIIRELAAEWNALCDEGPSNEPFLRPEWFEAIAENFGYMVELIAVRQTGRLRAVMPLTFTRSTLHGLPARKLKAVFNLNSPRFDLIHGADVSEKPAVLKAIWSVVRGRSDWNVMEIRLVRNDSWLNGLIEIADADLFRTGIWDMDSAPYIRLPAAAPKCSINEFLKGSRKQLRQQLDRRKRRLDDMGNTELVLTRKYTPELMERYFELETNGWKGRNGTAAIDDPNAVGLHHSFGRAVSDKGDLFAYELRLAGRTIAMSINIKSGGKMFHWKTAFDEAFSKYSPGNLLFKMFVTDCLERDVEEIDLLSPSTINKRYWSSGEREHVAFYIFPPGARGTIYWIWKFGVVAGLRGLRSHTRGANMEAAAAIK